MGPQRSAGEEIELRSAREGAISPQIAAFPPDLRLIASLRSEIASRLNQYLGEDAGRSRPCCTVAGWRLGLVPSCCSLSAYFPPEGGHGFGSVILLRPPEDCCASESMLPRCAAR